MEIDKEKIAPYVEMAADPKTAIACALWLLADIASSLEMLTRLYGTEIVNR